MVSYKSSEYVQDSDSDSDTDNQFEPPKNFHKVSNSASTPFPIASTVSNKEIWLIKAPKGFPINDLKSLPVSFTSTSINNGPAPVKVKGQSFQINEELLVEDATENRKYSILVNTKKNSSFIPLESQNIARFYNVRETVKIPKIDLEKVVIPRVDVEKVEDLRMRHFPTGYGAESYEEASVIPATTKRRAEGDDKETKRSKTEESPKKKSKKEKKEKKEKKDKKDKKEKKEKKEKH